jgi:hypothetical protein
LEVPLDERWRESEFSQESHFSPLNPPEGDLKTMKIAIRGLIVNLKIKTGFKGR